MKPPRWLNAVIGVFLLVMAGASVLPARAEEIPPDEPERKATLTVNFTRHFWWLAEWEGNEVVCRLAVEHEGIPTYNEIEGLCGKKVAQRWLESKPCNLAETPAARCPGLYALEIGSEPASREVEVILPLPSVWIHLEDCGALPGERACTRMPTLLLEGREPLPNETILSIQGTFNGEAFICAGGECRLPLQPTGQDGAVMEFWADSSFGDSSEHYTARVRVLPWGDFMDPDGGGRDSHLWYVDILSTQYTEGEIAACAFTWQSFPGIHGPPAWLSTPARIEDLRTDTGFYYLAGALIQNGLVDTSACLDGGLTAANVASACGVEAARLLLTEWQNRFDDDIWQASQETGVPARLLKNVFARESQLWPGVFHTTREAGLGQLTEKGADTILLWNPEFFRQFCPLVLHQSTCDLGFGNLKENEQALLRGALVRKVNASCPDCPTGIDISGAQYSVRVFAEGLLANCEQTGRILTNLTGMEPGRLSRYEDLWRFTLVNYNAGAGCLSTAARRVLNNGDALTWENLAAQLDPACQGAIGYVEDISGERRVLPTPTPWLGGAPVQVTPPRVLSTPTPVPLFPTATPTAQSTAAPSEGTPTPTPEVYLPP